MLLTAASKPPKDIAAAHGENDAVSLEAKLYIDAEAVKGIIGDDLGGHYIVAEIKFTPKYGKDLVLDRDDFTLRTDKDGEKAKSFVGSQIAGQSALIVSGDGEPAKKRGFTIGGPVMMGSPESQGEKGPTKSAIKSDQDEKPLKKTLDSKILPEGKTTQPVSGLLYFPMEKQKMKDLELQYGGKDNRISLRFK